MRVIAGDLRGRRLVTPEGTATRPTTDKVREAIFNALGSLDVVYGARCADLFAGSGAVGIEALSRGATHCTFVERDREALRALRQNLSAVGCDDRARVIPGDASAMAGALEVDVVFADPPYGFDAWERLLSALRAPFVVTESGESLDQTLGEPAGFEIVRARRYGRTWVTFWSRPTNH